jgi:hypothetical protein
MIRLVKIDIIRDNKNINLFELHFYFSVVVEGLISKNIFF